MRDIGQRLLIGLAAVAVGVMVIGYAFIAGNIAAPIGRDLGIFKVPEAPGAAPLLLEDGRPAFIVADEGQVIVLDARAPHGPGSPGRLVAWCQLETTGIFLDLVDGPNWDADGALRSEGPGGLVRYPVREVSAGRVSVGAEGRSVGVTDGERAGLDCVTNRWLVHEPAPGEVFDPSVAADQQPPGWIWLEGTLAARDGEVLLCDGLDDGCATSAPVRGIDPAIVPDGDRRLAGLFVGRVRDGTVEDLNAVPSPGGTTR